MNLRAYRTFQALILGGLGIYLFVKVMDGRILLYINQRFIVLVLFAALAMILLAQFTLRQRPSLQEEGSERLDHRDSELNDHNSRNGRALWLLALPILIGVLVPERPLGAGVLDRRGINTTSTYTIQGGAARALDIPSPQRSVLDWIRVVSEEEDPAALDGQPADVTGFVYHDIRLTENQFMVGRFSIACCVADATALGMIVAWGDSAALEDNQWVRVRGPVRLIQMNGKTLAAIEARTVEQVPEPEQPYLFP